MTRLTSIADVVALSGKVIAVNLAGSAICPRALIVAVGKTGGVGVSGIAVGVAAGLVAVEVSVAAARVGRTRVGVLVAPCSDGEAGLTVWVAVGLLFDPDMTGVGWPFVQPAKNSIPMIITETNI